MKSEYTSFQMFKDKQTIYIYRRQNIPVPYLSSDVQSHFQQVSGHLQLSPTMCQQQLLC